MICTEEKVQAEINRVIGPSRQPSTADKPHMPYTEAVIHEIQRMGNIVPLNGLRVASRDTKLAGYIIPKVEKTAAQCYNMLIYTLLLFKYEEHSPTQGSANFMIKTAIFTPLFTKFKSVQSCNDLLQL